MLELTLTLFITLTLMTLYSINPLSLGALILMQTIIICQKINFIMNTFWFSYILFLTFLGGLLILFLYLMIIASNEMYLIKAKNFWFIIMTMSLTYLMIKFSMYMNFSKNIEFCSLSNLIITNKMIFMNSKLSSNFSYIISIIMMNYLFLMLIISNKIINIFSGPLRKSSH